MLHGRDPEAAPNQFWKAVDQAYGKPTEHLEVQAGPIPPEDLETRSDERIAERLKELEAESGSESDGYRYPTPSIAIGRAGPLAKKPQGQPSGRRVRSGSFRCSARRPPPYVPAGHTDAAA